MSFSFLHIGISHHKTNSLNISLLQRESRLVLFLRIASFVAFAKPFSERTRWDSLVIKIEICDKSIPVVVSALKYLLNTLSYFHAFLPFNCSMHIYKPSSSYGFLLEINVARAEVRYSRHPILLHYSLSHPVARLCSC